MEVHADRFSFVLPGDDWAIRGANCLTDLDAQLSRFLSREKAESPQAAIEARIAALLADGRGEVVSRAMIDVGPLSGDEASVIAPFQGKWTYFRFAAVGYYDQVLLFGVQCAEPRQAHADERFARWLETVKLRRR